MKLFLVLAFSYVYALGSSDDRINKINAAQNLWQAGKNTLRTPMHKLVGVSRLPKAVLDSIPVVEHNISEDDDIPESFDAREKWPECSSIKDVLDQGSCRSGYAVSVASAISDRICIHSKGNSQPIISAKNIITCAIGSKGCLGGQEIMSWRHYQSNGVVTGGPYNSSIGCQPYPFAPCEHIITGSRPECVMDPIPTPQCSKTCDNSSIKFEDDLHYGNETYLLPNNVKQIQMELMKNGPVVAVQEIYADFALYKKGVYSKISDVHNIHYGTHAIKLIGWGVENSTDYWLVVNSWNEDWGDRGLYKIRRGTNECKIEGQVSAGSPKL